MSLVVDQFQALTDYASVVNRLAVFEESCEKAATKQDDDQRQIEVVEDDSQIALKNITLATPDRARVSQQDTAGIVKQFALCATTILRRTNRGPRRIPSRLPYGSFEQGGADSVPHQLVGWPAGKGMLLSESKTSCSLSAKRQNPRACGCQTWLSLCRLVRRTPPSRQKTPYFQLPGAGVEPPRSFRSRGF